MQIDQTLQLHHNIRKSKSMLKKSTFSFSVLFFFRRYSNQNQKERESSLVSGVLAATPHSTGTVLCVSLVHNKHSAPSRPSMFSVQTEPPKPALQLNHHFKTSPSVQAEPPKPAWSSVQAEPPKPALHVFSAS